MSHFEMLLKPKYFLAKIKSALCVFLFFPFFFLTFFCKNIFVVVILKKVHLSNRRFALRLLLFDYVQSAFESVTYWICKNSDLKIILNGAHLKVKCWVHQTGTIIRLYTISKQSVYTPATNKSRLPTFRRSIISGFTPSNTWADKIKFFHQIKQCGKFLFLNDHYMAVLLVLFKEMEEAVGNGLFLPKKLLTADRDQWRWWWYKFWTASLYWSGCNGSQDGWWSKQRTSVENKWNKYEYCRLTYL